MLPIVPPPLNDHPVYRVVESAQFYGMPLFHSLRERIRARRIQVYGVGAPKTGTHSLAALFQPHYRAAHEAQPLRTIETAAAWVAPQPDAHTRRAYVRQRDASLDLEVEASSFLLPFLPELVTLFPESKFILTVREPRAWLDSWLNAALSTRVPRRYYLNRMVVYAPLHHGFLPEEKILEKVGLYSLDAFFGTWARHNRTVLETVPPERLLIVKTAEIHSSLTRIAEFLQIPAATLNSARTHEFKTAVRYKLLDQIPPDYLEAKIQQHCAPLFPRLGLVDSPVLGAILNVADRNAKMA